MINIKEAIASACVALTPISPSPRLDAELLMSYCIKRPRSFLYSHPEYILNANELSLWDSLITRRKASWPIAYLTGEKEFWSLNFKVSIDSLIPRPATESLIEYILSTYPANTPINLCDLGTGTGAIAIVLAKERPLWQITAVDIHPGTLALARFNAARHGCDQIQFRCSHWLQKLPQGHYDLIISNPPYIAADDPHLHEGDVQHEPWRALVSDDAGYKDLKHLIQESMVHLKPQGKIILEHGYQQQETLSLIMQDYGFAVETYLDASQLPRFCVGHQKPNLP